MSRFLVVGAWLERLGQRGEAWEEGPGWKFFPRHKGWWRKRREMGVACTPSYHGWDLIYSAKPTTQAVYPSGVPERGTPPRCDAEREHRLWRGHSAALECEARQS